MRPRWDTAAQNAAELEALQTDVMRFVAILGLCLAAIFSLVNGAQQERATEATPEQTLAPAPVVDIPEPVSPQPAPEQEPQRANREPQRTYKEPQRAYEEPQRANREPQRVYEEPQRVNEEPQRANREPQLVYEDPQPVTSQLHRADEEPRHDAERDPQAQPNPFAPASPAEDAPAATPAQQGFSLEFESTAVMAALVQSGLVQLYASADKRFWLYQPGRGLRAVDAPAHYYEMHAATVPAELRRLSTGVISGAVRWGVTLPERTTVEIQRLMQGAEGGSLLIGEGAAVGLE